MVEKYTSVKHVIEGLYRDNDISEEVNYLDIIEWIGESLESVGAYSQYKQKSIELDLCDYRVGLPCDFHKLLSLSYQGNHIMPATSTLGNIVPTGSTVDEPLINGQPVTFPQISNSPLAGDGFTYQVNDNFIISNLREGCILLSYLGIPTDKEGFPLIPENYYYIKAIKLYVTYMMDRMQWRQGKLPDKIYMESKNEWQWYTQAARSAAIMPGINEMENFKNQWLRLRPMLDRHAGFFKDLSSRERLRQHPTNNI